MTKQRKEDRNTQTTAAAVAGSSSEPLAQQSDEQLFKKYRAAGDSAVFAALVKRYQRELYNYLKRFLGNASMAEDVFQATFLQVHVKQELFQSGRKFRPWLYTIATNQAIDFQRRNKRHRRLSLDQSHSAGSEQMGTLLDVVVGSEADPAETIDNNEQAQWVRSAVAGLPETLSSAVNLVYFKGMKYRDAAEIMDIPVGTVKSRLHSALGRLGDAWSDMKDSKTA